MVQFIQMILLIQLVKVESLFCKNCKYFIQQHGIPESFGKCGLFPTIEQNFFLITGIAEEKHDFYYCSTARSVETMCGEKGKHYQK